MLLMPLKAGRLLCLRSCCAVVVTVMCPPPPFAGFYFAPCPTARLVNSRVESAETISSPDMLAAGQPGHGAGHGEAVRRVFLPAHQARSSTCLPTICCTLSKCLAPLTARTCSMRGSLKTEPRLISCFSIPDICHCKGCLLRCTEVHGRKPCSVSRAELLAELFARRAGSATSSRSGPCTRRRS